MLNPNPSVRFQQGEWVADIFENIQANEPHVCIYKGLGQHPPKAVEWPPVQKLFLQLKAEGFFDKYKGQKLWVGFPKYNPNNKKTEINFVTVTKDDSGDRDEGGDCGGGCCGTADEE